jgi:hypothetical protein
MFIPPHKSHGLAETMVVPSSFSFICLAGVLCCSSALRVDDETMGGQANATNAEAVAGAVAKANAEEQAAVAAGVPEEEAKAAKAEAVAGAVAKANVEEQATVAAAQASNADEVSVESTQDAAEATQDISAVPQMVHPSTGDVQEPTKASNADEVPVESTQDAAVATQDIEAVPQDVVTLTPAPGDPWLTPRRRRSSWGWGWR